MAKLGEEYEEIVAAVERALDRAADVKVGQWIEGPDGGREIDVEVRSMRNGEPYFVLVECKDWKRPVDIGEIDKVEGKGRDLGANRLVLYSNSGFTAKALRKAMRVGIGCASALMSGERRIRGVVEREYVAKRLSVDKWSLEIVGRLEDADRISAYDPQQLQLAGDPVVNWLQKMTLYLLREYEGHETVIAEFAFREPTEFHAGAGPLRLIGFRLRLTCSRRWFAQRVREDVTTGLYDCINRRLIVPDQEQYTIGPFQHDAWYEVEACDVTEPGPGEFQLKMTQLNPIKGDPSQATPDIDVLIAERAVRFV